MRKVSTKLFVCASLAALMVFAVACIGHAAQIVPVSYTGGEGEGSWSDPAGIRLTDGVLGSDVYADGTWLGWQTLNPEIVFDFGSAMNFTGAAVQSLNSQGAGIYLVKGIDISFSNDGVEYGSPVHFESTYDQYATIAGSQSIVSAPFTASGQYAKMTFTRWVDNYWFFVSEVSFEGEPVPEPGSLLALFGGLSGLAGFALRRKR